MAIGTVTRVGQHGGGDPGKPVFADVLSFPGDGAYLAGGTAAIGASLVANSYMRGKTVIAIHHLYSSNVAYFGEWDRANDKFKIKDLVNGIEVANGDYSGTTFQVLVLTT